jgi:hypothetical protein
MKRILICIALLASLPCLAMTEEDEVSKPMHYALIPSVGYHIGFSEMSGSNAVSSGFMGGLAFRFLRDGYFFTPGARLIGLVGLDKTPATMWTVGFIAGGHLKSPSVDLFLGADIAKIIDYKTGTAALVRIGTIFDLGLSDFQVVLDGFYGNFSQTTATKLISYPYPGMEISLQLPIDL